MPQITVNLIHDLKQGHQIKEHVPFVYGLRTGYLRAWFFTAVKVMFIIGLMNGVNVATRLEDNIGLLDKYLRNDFTVAEDFIIPNHVSKANQKAKTIITPRGPLEVPADSEEMGLVAAAVTSENTPENKKSYSGEIAGDTSVQIPVIAPSAIGLTGKSLEAYIDEVIRYNLVNALAARFILPGTGDRSDGCLQIDVNNIVTTRGSRCGGGGGGGGSSGGGSFAMGSTVTGATQDSVFFAGPGGALTQDNTNFNFNDTTDKLTVGGDIESGGDVNAGGDVIAGGDADVTGDALIGGNITVTGLAGNGTRCLQTDNAGIISVAGAACGAGGSAQTPWISNIDADGFDLQNAGSINGLVITPNTGTITSGVWNGTALTDAYVSDTLTASYFVGSGSTTTAVDLATLEVNGTLAVGNGGTGTTTLTSNGVLYGNGTGAIQATAQGGANTVLIANNGAPSFSSAITVGTSVTSPIINATTALQINGADLNTAGTLSNVAYLNQANIFTLDQTVRKSDPAIVFDVATATDTDFWMGVTDDGDGVDDDLFQIGDGTTPGTNPFLTINTNGNVGVGDSSPAALLTVGSGDLFQISASGLLAISPTSTALNIATFTQPAVSSGGGLATSWHTIGIINGSIAHTSGAGSKDYDSINITNPDIIQTTGTITVNGLNMTTGSHTTGGTQRGFNLNASGVAAGTLIGINISGITSGAGTETAIIVGNGWDKAATFGAAVDVTGALTATSVIQGGSATATTYSRLGTASTGHSLNAADDLLISDDLEVDGDAFFDGNVTITGICTGCGGGSQTPWTSNIDADNFDLLDFGDNLTARAGLTIGAVTDLVLQSGGSGSIYLQPSSINSRVEISSANLVVGAGTPDLSLNGEDAYITGTFEVDGTALFNSNINVTKNDASILFADADSDTDFWLGVQEDAGNDDDDIFQIGDGSTPGTNPFLTIDTNGFVGLGDTAPSRRLTLFESGTAAQIRMGFSDSSYWEIGRENNVTGRFSIIDESGEKLSILNNGNVGINAIAPIAALDVEGSMYTLGGNGDVTNNGSLSGVDASMINSYLNGSGSLTAEEYARADINGDGSVTLLDAELITNIVTLSITLPQAQHSVGKYIADRSMSIAYNGNVGIGTFGTSPTTKLEIGSSDLGNGTAGPVVTIGRNTNATNTGAGSINFQSKGGTAGYVWQDNAGNVRINTAAPSNANDTAGTVIGTQSSTRVTKQDIHDYTDFTSALQMVADAPLHTFRYKKDVQGYGANSPLAKERIGYIADEVPGAFMWGNSIDQVSVNGILMASVKALNNKVNAIQTAPTSQGNQDEPLPMSQPAWATTPLHLASHLYLSGDNVGQAKILEGEKSVRVTFTSPYEFQPIVTVTPNGRVGSEYWVDDKDSTGFTIYMDDEVNHDVTFDWHSFAGENAKLTVSDGTQEDIILVISYQNSDEEASHQTQVLGDETIAAPEETQQDTQQDSPADIPAETQITPEQPASETPAEDSNPAEHPPVNP